MSSYPVALSSLRVHGTFLSRVPDCALATGKSPEPADKDAIPRSSSPARKHPLADRFREASPKGASWDESRRCRALLPRHSSHLRAVSTKFPTKFPTKEMRLIHRMSRLPTPAGCRRSQDQTPSGRALKVLAESI